MMGRGHTPFGYRIENGCAVVNADEAEQIRKVYAGYLSGQGYIEAAKSAGLTMTHSVVKRMLRNRHYRGDDFYLEIIDQKIFDAAEAERQKRLEIMGRSDGRKLLKEGRKVYIRFSIGTIAETHEDPYVQAAYIYSLIESEE